MEFEQAPYDPHMYDGHWEGNRWVPNRPYVEPTWGSSDHVVVRHPNGRVSLGRRVSSIPSYTRANFPGSAPMGSGTAHLSALRSSAARVATGARVASRFLGPAGAVISAGLLAYDIYGKVKSHNKNTMSARSSASMASYAGSVNFGGSNHGLASVDALHNISYTKSRANLRGRYKKGSKFYKQSKPHLISRFQGLSHFVGAQDDESDGYSTYGLYPIQLLQKSLPILLNPANIASNITCDTIMLPMFAYNLSALPVGWVYNPYPSGTDAYNQGGGALTTPATISVSGVSIPMMQLCKASFVVTSGDNYRNSSSVYYWVPVRGSQNAPSGATTSQNKISGQTADETVNFPRNSGGSVEQSVFLPQVQAPVYNHDWSDIRLAFDGALSRPTCFKVSIVNFLRPEVSPSRIWMTESDYNAANRQVTDASMDKVLFKDLNDARFNNIEKAFQSGGLSCGFNTETIPPFVFPVPSSVNGQPQAEDVELHECTSMWESYWTNRMGHPLAYTKNFAPHKKYMNVKYSQCIALAQKSSATDGTASVKKHMHSIFKKFNKCHDTFIAPADVETNLLSVNAPDPVKSNSIVGTGFAQKFSYANCHIYGNDRRADDWLIIEADMPYQAIDKDSESSLTSGNFLPYWGGLKEDESCYTPGGAFTGFRGTPGKCGSFDISVRSKFDVVNAGFVVPASTPLPAPPPP